MSKKSRPIMGAIFVGVLVALSPCAIAAASLQSLGNAVDKQDWPRARQIASELDRDAHRGDFYITYVDASALVMADKCAEVWPLLAALQHGNPYFTPTYELAYLCHKQSGDDDAALADLDAMLAALPEGPQRDLAAQLRQNQASRGWPSISVFGQATPSTNIERQTVSTDLKGLAIKEESRGHPGIRLGAGATVAKTLVESPLATLSAAATGQLQFSTADNLFRPLLTAELPVTLKAPGEIDVLLSPFASLGARGLAFDTASTGLRAVASKRVTEATSIAWSNTASFTKFASTPYRDGFDLDTVLSLVTLMTPSLRVGVTATADLDYTLDPDHRTLEFILALRADQVFENGIVVGAEASVGRRLHSTPPPLSSGSNQIDTFLAGRIELSHRQLTVGPFMPALYYEYRNQMSDSVFYTYQSHDVGLSLKAKL